MADAPDVGWDYKPVNLVGHDEVALEYGRYMASFAATEQNLLDFFGIILEPRENSPYWATFNPFP